MNNDNQGATGRNGVFDLMQKVYEKLVQPVASSNVIESVLKSLTSSQLAELSERLRADQHLYQSRLVEATQTLTEDADGQSVDDARRVLGDSMWGLARTANILGHVNEEQERRLEEGQSDSIFSGDEKNDSGVFFSASGQKETSLTDEASSEVSLKSSAHLAEKGEDFKGATQALLNGGLDKITPGQRVASYRQLVAILDEYDRQLNDQLKDDLKQGAQFIDLPNEIQRLFTEERYSRVAGRVQKMTAEMNSIFPVIVNLAKTKQTTEFAQQIKDDYEALKKQWADIAENLVSLSQIDGGDHLREKIQAQISNDLVNRTMTFIEQGKQLLNGQSLLFQKRLMEFDESLSNARDNAWFCWETRPKYPDELDRERWGEAVTGEMFSHYGADCSYHAVEMTLAIQGYPEMLGYRRWIHLRALLSGKHEFSRGLPTSLVGGPANVDELRRLLQVLSLSAVERKSAIPVYRQGQYALPFDDEALTNASSLNGDKRLAISWGGYDCHYGVLTSRQLDDLNCWSEVNSTNWRYEPGALYKHHGANFLLPIVIYAGIRYLGGPSTLLSVHTDNAKAAVEMQNDFDALSRVLNDTAPVPVSYVPGASIVHGLKKIGVYRSDHAAWIVEGRLASDKVVTFAKEIESFVKKKAVDKSGGSFRAIWQKVVGNSNENLPTLIRGQVESLIASAGSASPEALHPEKINELSFSTRRNIVAGMFSHLLSQVGSADDRQEELHRKQVLLRMVEGKLDMTNAEDFGYSGSKRDVSIFRFLLRDLNRPGMLLHSIISVAKVETTHPLARYLMYVKRGLRQEFGRETSIQTGKVSSQSYSVDMSGASPLEPGARFSAPVYRDELLSEASEGKRVQQAGKGEEIWEARLGNPPMGAKNATKAHSGRSSSWTPESAWKALENLSVEEIKSQHRVIPITDGRRPAGHVVAITADGAIYTMAPIQKRQDQSLILQRIEPAQRPRKPDGQFSPVTPCQTLPRKFKLNIPDEPTRVKKGTRFGLKK
ncbi:MAG TPA: hypothetical protein VM532_00990 [Burkholderiales bacterium]|nr:hypothetical protein [Burkholderiales bacterium]